MIKNKKTLRMNKKGFVLDIIVWVAITMVVVLFLGFWVYAHGILNSKMNELGMQGNSNVNLTDASKNTIGKVNDELANGLHNIAFVIIFCLGISILITNFYVKAHPVFFVVYVFIVVLAVVFSVYVSNSYEDLLSGFVFSDTLQEFTATNYIMLNLPIWVTVLGLIGAVFLFVGIIRDKGTEGGII